MSASLVDRRILRKLRAGHQWFMPVNLATSEAEIRKIVVQD
jgi:hypothetical protein